MATHVARVARNHEVRTRLTATLAAIAERLDIEVPPEPRRMKDADLQPIVELERFAAFADAVLAAIDPDAAAAEAEAKTGYEAMTVAELREMLDERNLEIPASARKADLIAALDADDDAR